MGPVVRAMNELWRASGRLSHGQSWAYVYRCFQKYAALTTHPSMVGYPFRASGALGAMSAKPGFTRHLRTEKVRGNQKDLISAHTCRALGRPGPSDGPGASWRSPILYIIRRKPAQWPRSRARLCR